MSISYRTTAGGGNTTGANPAVAITPAVNDLFVVFCQAVGNANTAPTCSDSNGGTYTRLWTAQSNGSANTLSCFVRNALLPNTTSTTVTVATGTSTAVEVVVCALTGATAAGTAAISQSATQQNQGSGSTPQAVLPNPTSPYSGILLSALGNMSSPTGVAVTPNGWSSKWDVGQTGCGIAVEAGAAISNPTVTWGSSSSTAYSVGAVEIVSSPTNAGVNVSKVVGYVLPTAPNGVNVSKALAYLLPTPPMGVSLSKLTAYAVLGAINTNPPVWPSFTFNNSVLDSPYSQTWDLSPAASPTTYTLNSGSLPTGLSLTNVSADVGQISGTPTVTGTFTFTLLATNTYGSSVSPSFSISVLKPSGSASAPVITGTVLGTGTVGIAYSNPLAISGGQTPYMVAVSAGSLPNGITLNTSGSPVTLSGTPTTVGTFNFSLTTTDANNSSTTQSFTILVNTETIVPLGTGLPSAVIGQPYSETLYEAGGAGPYTFAITAGALPAGLTMTSAGVISGIATTPGTASFTVAVTDGNNISGSVPLTLAVVLPGSNSSWVF